MNAAIAVMRTSFAIAIGLSPFALAQTYQIWDVWQVLYPQEPSYFRLPSFTLTTLRVVSEIAFLDGLVDEMGPYEPLHKHLT